MLLRFGFQISLRKNKILIIISGLCPIIAGVISIIIKANSPWVYLVWSVAAICFAFDESIMRLFALSLYIMVFSSVVDTFSVMLIRISFLTVRMVPMHIKGLEETAYLISIVFYLIIYKKILKKNHIYLCDLKLKYLLTLICVSFIFYMFYDFVFYPVETKQLDYNWYSYVAFAISIIGAVYSISFVLSSSVKNIILQQQNENLKLLAKMQQQQYKYQTSKDLSLRKFRHDLKNHIGVLRALLGNNEISEAETYIKKIWDVQNEYKAGISTGDSRLDTIVNYYAYIASEKKIKFVCNGALSSNIKMDMLDITTLFGNLLQNAVEASQTIECPYVNFSIIEKTNELFIVVENATNKQEKEGIFTTSKNDKDNHGFGLTNIKDVVKKCYGECYIDYSKASDGGYVFKVSIGIPGGNDENRNFR